MKHKLIERELQSVIVLGNPAWRPALLGLAANTLMDTYHRPVFAWGRDGRNVIIGSCRSDGSVSVVALMAEMQDTLLDFGGHHFSGGFAIADEHIHAFPSRVLESYAKVAGVAAPEPEKRIDATLALADVTDRTYRDIEMLSPFGEGNRKPLFQFRAVTPLSIERFGRARDHTKAVFQDGARTIEAIVFFTEPDGFGTPLVAGQTVDLIAHIEQSYFGNRRSLRLRIVDVV
jgi:single-stranded-DNA-specific exonuclease